MNKTKITLLAIGGVSFVGTLVFGYLIYSAWNSAITLASSSSL